MESPIQTRPAHVPAELVRPFPYLTGARTFDDPYAYIDGMRDYPSTFWAEHVIPGVGGAWVPRRAKDIRFAFSDSEHFSAMGFAPFAKLCGESWYLVPAEMDPPDHGLLRGVISPLFTPKRMADLDGKIRQHARDHVRALAPLGECDFMEDFAFAFPIKVFLELMGLPQERLAQFMSWERGVLQNPDIGEIIAATRAINAYLAEECEDRRRHPRDDLISFAVQADVKGRPMSADELTGFCFNLFVGGLDSVSANMGLQFRHLAEHRDDQHRLRAQPELIPDALNELMRAYAPVMTNRTCIKAVELGGQEVRPGDRVVLPTFLAGRDPDEYPDPNRVILDRRPRHVTFGYGHHTCIGMHLARREMLIAMEEFLKGVPEFLIAPGARIESYLAATIQPVSLPLVWEKSR